MSDFPICDQGSCLQPALGVAVGPRQPSARLEALRGRVTSDVFEKLRNFEERNSDNSEKVDKIFSTVEKIDTSKDPNLLNKIILRGGGISFLEKLSGVPSELHNDILVRAVQGKVYFAGLNKILSEALGKDVSERGAFLEKALRCLDKLGSAERAQSALKTGVSGLFSAAGQAGGSGGGVGAGSPFANGGMISASPAGSTFTTTSTIQPADPKSNLVEFFSKLPKAQKDRYELIAAAVLQFAEDIRKEKEEEKKSNEELCASRRPFTVGSAETVEDLERALSEIIERSGNFNNAIPNIRQYIQTCYKFNVAGENIVVGNVLEVLEGWLDLFRRTNQMHRQVFPTNQQHPQNQLSPQPPTAQPPAPSLADSGPLNMSSHQA